MPINYICIDRDVQTKRPPRCSQTLKAVTYERWGCDFYFYFLLYTSISFAHFFIMSIHYSYSCFKVEPVRIQKSPIIGLLILPGWSRGETQQPQRPPLCLQGFLDGHVHGADGDQPSPRGTRSFSS